MDVEILTWRELTSHAGSAARARLLLRRGDWWRVMRDAYARGELLEAPEVRLAAVRRLVPRHAAISHRAAAWLLGLDVLGGALDVTAPRLRQMESRPGLRTHTAQLQDADLCRVDGYLVVSAARAFVDVARSESLVEAVTFGDALLRAGATDAARIADALDRAAGLRNVCRAREVVQHLEPRSESPMESRMRMRLVLAGLPRPDAQFDVYDDDGHCGRGDLHLDGVILEYDGRESRLSKAAFVQERRRQGRISDVGLELRRLTSHDYYVRPASSVHADVLRALEVARGRDRSRLRSGPDTLRPPRLTPLPTLAEHAAQLRAA